MMWTRLIGRLGTFGRDEAGAFMIMFGLMAIVLVATAGAVVDYTTVEQARNRAQIALDSAALALQPSIYTKSADQIMVEADALLKERMAGTVQRALINDIEIDLDEGGLLLRAQVDIRMAFVSLIGFPAMSANLVSEATRKRLNLEVAMVLDNSGSMLQQNRMTHLKAAAENATDILFDGEDEQDNVFVSVVPFTMYVNVGANNANADWIDRFGHSSIHHDNFAGTVNRLALYDSIRNDSWRGCVEARPHPFDTDDTTPTSANPDTLFVPLFAPDLPAAAWAWGSGHYNNYTDDLPPQCGLPAGQCACESYRQSGGGSGGNSTQWQCTLTRADGTTTTSNGFNACWCQVPNPQHLANSGNRTNRQRHMCLNYDYTASDRTKQERICKYEGATLNFTSGQKGPNADCPYVATLPLTNQANAVKAAIDAMVADGGTNIHEGAAWGMRTLTPGVPFDQGRPHDESTAKVMIVMTDGENTAYPTNNINGSYYFSAYGFPYNERMGTIGWSNNQLVTEMDRRTLMTCETAKSMGIRIYTIGLSVPNQRTRTMLTDCATRPADAHFPDDPSDLTEVFATIAEQLAALRLSL